MAQSQYEYVKAFELSDTLLPHCWIVCRIDGVAFTKFTAAHALEKPNDRRAMNVMNTAAKAVMTRYPDICICIGMSDEYSFVIHPTSTLYSRRASKINSAIVSLFTSSFVFHWNEYFPTSPLQGDNLPFFDGRVVCYPTDASVKDYLRWRQVDAHINNLYNTAFWMLVHEYQRGGAIPPGAEAGSAPSPPLSEREARERAHADMHRFYASSAQKHELLHSRFGVNYNNEPEEFRKGSILVWAEVPAQAGRSEGAAVAAAADSTSDAAAPAASSPSAAAAAAATPVASPHPRSSPPAPQRVVQLLHCDVINDAFYTTLYPGIVPYVSPTQARKDARAAEKNARKAAYKAAEKEAKAKAKEMAMAMAANPAQVAANPAQVADVVVATAAAPATVVSAATPASSVAPTSAATSVSSPAASSSSLASSSLSLSDSSLLSLLDENLAARSLLPLDSATRAFISDSDASILSFARHVPTSELESLLPPRSRAELAMWIVGFHRNPDPGSFNAEPLPFEEQRRDLEVAWALLQSVDRGVQHKSPQQQGGTLSPAVALGSSPLSPAPSDASASLTASTATTASSPLSFSSSSFFSDGVDPTTPRRLPFLMLDLSSRLKDARKMTEVFERILVERGVREALHRAAEAGGASAASVSSSSAGGGSSIIIHHGVDEANLDSSVLFTLLTEAEVLALWLMAGTLGRWRLFASFSRALHTAPAAPATPAPALLPDVHTHDVIVGVDGSEPPLLSPSLPSLPPPVPEPEPLPILSECAELSLAFQRAASIDFLQLDRMVRDRVPQFWPEPTSSELEWTEQRVVESVWAVRRLDGTDDTVRYPFQALAARCPGSPVPHEAGSLPFSLHHICACIRITSLVSPQLPIMGAWTELGGGGGGGGGGGSQFEAEGTDLTEVEGMGLCRITERFTQFKRVPEGMQEAQTLMSRSRQQSVDEGKGRQQQQQQQQEAARFELWVGVYSCRVVSVSEEDEACEEAPPLVDSEYTLMLKMQRKTST